MRTKLLTIGFLTVNLLSHNLFAQEKKDEAKIVQSKLNEATVFFRGAELTHNAKTDLTKGENLIKIEGLSPDIDHNSLKISATNGVLISAHEFSVDYLSESKSNPQLKRLNDSVEFYTNKLTKLNTEIKINNELATMLQRGTDKNISGSDKGLGIDELMKTMEYYKSKSGELENIKAKQQKELQQINKSLESFQKQLLQESLKNNKSSGILSLTLSSPLATTCNFTISYYTQSASWVPYYDINIPDTEKPIRFVSKAKIRQTTGLDWEKVKLTLSTSTPSSGKIAPLFTTWFLSPSSPSLKGAYAKISSIPASQISYTYADAKQVSERISADVDVPENDDSQAPIYIVNNNIVSQEDFESLDPSIVKETSFIEGSTAINQYGAGASGGVYLVTLKNSMDDYVSVSDNQMNLAINVDIPFSVPGNGKEQSIDLQTKETTAKYKYYCAPKLDTETYLLAEIADWEKLNLLTGKANITYNGTYVGETQIDASSTQKTLSLTLGSDKRVNVKREKLQDFSSKRFLNNDVKQIFTYKLTVRNNQNKAIKMVLKDQYPISTQKNIEVELLKDSTTPWTVNVEALGVISWEEELKAGETKVYNISYSVKYPKNLELNL